jgi:predicted nucleotidyltransferase
MRNANKPIGRRKMEEEVKNILSEIVEKLKREYKPLKIILFGSYA